VDVGEKRRREREEEEESVDIIMVATMGRRVVDDGEREERGK